MKGTPPMHVSYAPEDGDRQTWTFEPGRIRASAAEMMERRFGENWDSFVAGVQSGNMRARRVLLWHMLTRDHATLRFEDVPDFFSDELKVQFSVAELEILRERITKMALSDSDRERALTGVDLELSEARERESADEPGKAS